MKKLFNAPEMAISKFEVENILTTSGGVKNTETYSNAQAALETAIGGNAGTGRSSADNIFEFNY